jgi:hypothetical protein
VVAALSQRLSVNYFASTMELSHIKQIELELEKEVNCQLTSWFLTLVARL